MTLIEIVSALREALWTVEDLEGEILPGMEDEIAALEDALETKIDAVLAVAQEFDARAEVAKERAAIQQQTARAMTNQASRLREYVKTAMLGAGFKKIETERFPRVRLQTVAPSVVVDDVFVEWAQTEGRDDLLRYKPPEPDRKAIKVAIDSGEVFHGAVLSAPGWSLRWK